MKATHVSAISGVAGAGAVIAQRSGLSTNNRLMDGIIGLVVATGSWFLDIDGASDAGIGAGLGYLLGAIL